MFVAGSDRIRTQRQLYPKKEMLFLVEVEGIRELGSKQSMKNQEEGESRVP